MGHSGQNGQYAHLAGKVFSGRVNKEAGYPLAIFDSVSSGALHTVGASIPAVMAQNLAHGQRISARVGFVPHRGYTVVKIVTEEPALTS